MRAFSSGKANFRGNTGSKIWNAGKFLLTGPLFLWYTPNQAIFPKCVEGVKLRCGALAENRRLVQAGERRRSGWRRSGVSQRAVPVGCHGFASVIRAGACWSPLSARSGAKPGGTAVKEFLSPREQSSAPGAFLSPGRTENLYSQPQTPSGRRSAAKGRLSPKRAFGPPAGSFPPEPR